MNKPIGERVAFLESIVGELCEDIKDIKNKLLGRPSWSVSVIITLLTTLCTGLLIVILTQQYGII